LEKRVFAETTTFKPGRKNPADLLGCIPSVK